MLSEIWIFARVIWYKMWLYKKKKKEYSGFYGKKKLFVLYRRENIKTITITRYIKPGVVQIITEEGGIKIISKYLEFVIWKKLYEIIFLLLKKMSLCVITGNIYW